VLDVADYSGMIVDYREDLCAAIESPPRCEIEAQLIVQPPQCVGLVVRVRCQPNVRHPTAVNQLLQIKTSKRPGRRHLARTVTCRCIEHDSIYHGLAKFAT
jgi:hypothetical protein